MTVPASQTNYVFYTGDGATTAFAFPYVFYNGADLRVWVIDLVGAVAAQTLGVDYTVAGGADATGTINFVTAPTTGYTVYIFGTPVDGQGRSFPLAGPLPSTEVEKALDRLALATQWLQTQLNSCVQFPWQDRAGLNAFLPVPATRANKVLLFDASGNVGVAPFVVTAYGTALMSAANAAAARTLLGITVVNPNVVVEFAIANNVAPTNITGLVFDHTLYRYYRIAYDLYQQTDDPGSECREQGTLHASYSVEDAAWSLQFGDVVQSKFDPNYFFQMSGQQVQYSTGNLAGANYVGNLRYRIAEVF